MHVALAAAQIDLAIDETAKPVANRRHAAVEHRRIRDDDEVGAKLLLVRADEIVEVDAAHLFFAFEEELDVHRQAAVLFQMRLDGLEVHEHLALVVGRAARVELAVADGGLERRRLPQVERIHRLHVVVPVEEDGRRARRAQPVAVDDRVARRVDELHVLETDAPHLIAAPLRAAPHVRGVLGQRADAGNRQQTFQLVEIFLAVHVDEVDHVVHIHLGPIEGA